LSAGQRFAAQALRTSSFGVFVDVGAEVEALVHVSQLAEGYLSDPLEAAMPGDELAVELLSLDRGKRRISARLADLGDRGRKGGATVRKSRRAAEKEPAPRSGPAPPPITEEMAQGKAPLRSFSDLVQFYDRKRSQEDSSS
jgi:uncharacterized protein